MKTIKLILICLVAFLLGGPIMQAQLPTGTILGVVKDPSGAVVTGANVTARDTDTGQIRTAVTGAGGDYRLDALPVGNYEITAGASGFQTETQRGLTLAVGQEAVTNFSLQVGQAAQTVSVTAATTLVTTTASSLSSLVNPQRVEDLPLNGRNYNDLTMLQPGVTQSPTTNFTIVGWAGTQFSSNGAPLRSNSYLLDGSILNNALNLNGASATGSTLGVDGIQEFQTLTNDYDAQYGGHMGSQQVLVSKGGTNQFHGDVFEYLRNSALDSRNDFDLLPAADEGHRLPEFKRNQFGGSLGGPIQKDKTFFFGVYEGLRADTGTTNTDSTLAPGCQGAAGAVITLAACPQISPNASATIAPQMAPFVALYPLPNIPGTDEYGFVYQQIEIENYAQVRLDRTFSAKDNMFLRYTLDKATYSEPLYFNQSYVGVASFNQFVTLAENHIFSTALLNTARISYGRTPLGVTSVLLDPVLGTTPYIFEANAAGQMGRLSVGGLTQLGTDGTAPRAGNQALYAVGDDLDYTRGRQAFKVGFVFNYYLNYLTEHGYDKGLPVFASVSTFMEGQANSYNGFIPGGFFQHTYQFDTMGFYVQDDWRFKPRLTFNLGMRYEPSTTVTDIHGRNAAFRNPLTSTGPTIGPLFANPSLENWGPRVGFAWDLFGNGQTALRGGFGIFFDNSWASDGLGLNAESDPPFSYPYTGSAGPITIPFTAPAFGTFPLEGKGLPYDLKQPHLLSYNLTLEHQFPSQMGLTVSYTGSRGIDIMQLQDPNYEIPAGVPSANGSGTCVAAPAGATPNLASQIDGSATSCYLATNPRLNPALGSLGMTNGIGSSIYNAVQANLNKRMTHGLQFQVAYTYGRLIDDGQGEGGGDGGTDIVEPLHEASRRAPADFDIASDLHFNALYHLPEFVGSKGFESKLADGWWVGDIWSLESGDPFGILLSGLRSQDGWNDIDSTSTDTADLIPGRNNGNVTHGVSTGCGTGASRAAGGTAIPAGTRLHTKTLWYDPCAFSIQPTGFIGDAPRNFMWGPGVDLMNFSLAKDTAAPKLLGEGGMVEFRSEFFNIFNHPIFSNPGNSVSAGTCGGLVTACGPNVQNPASSGGIITSTKDTSRQIQFGLKILF